MTWAARHPWISAISMAVAGMLTLAILTTTGVLPAMPEEVFVQIIATAGLVVIAVISATAAQKKDTKRAANAAESAATDAALARDQLQNNHNTNLREENDERHEAVMKAINKVESQITSISTIVVGILQDDTTSRQQQSRVDGRLDRLEEAIVATGRKTPNAEEFLRDLEDTVDRREINDEMKGLS